MTRCDLHPRECSCIASNVPCRCQPSALEIIGEANNDLARHGPLALILLAAIVFAIVFCSGLTVGPVNV